MAFGDLNRINTNLQSLDAQFSLNRINKRLGETQLQLATGFRINKAEDDAAGFSISAKLSSRIAGLEQALNNTGDAKSILDIAEASFDSILDILTTMKAKATQAANDTYGEDERQFIQDQINSLGEELTALAEQTVFQGNELLSGDYTANFQVGERTDDVIEISINSTGTAGFSAADLGVDAGSLNVLTHAGAQGAMDDIDDAISLVASAVNQLGIDQTRLTIREQILTQSINSNSAARSRIRDTDFAQAQSESIKLQILQQTAIAALAQANSAPSSVLGFI